MTAWEVTFRRYPSTPPWSTEQLVVVTYADSPADLQSLLRTRHEEAVVDGAKRLGPALVWTDPARGTTASRKGANDA